MKVNFIGNCTVIIAIFIATAAPLITWRNAGADTRARDETLRKQKEAITELSAANAKRKEGLTGKNTGGLTDEQLKELLRLRAEAGALRRETNELERLRAENEFLQAKSSPDESPQPTSREERAAAVSGELMDAAKNIMNELPAAQGKFAAEHPGEKARQLAELRKYFPIVKGHHMPGLYSFQFVRDSGPQSGDTLILGESRTHPTAGGLPAKIYSFSDGHAEEIKAPAGEDADNFFEEWEKQHLNPALSQGQ